MTPPPPSSPSSPPPRRHPRPPAPPPSRRAPRPDEQAAAAPGKPTGFALKPVLTGDRVVLRPFTADDAPAMAEIIDDPEVRRYTGHPRTALTPRVLAAWYGSRGEQDDRLDLAVTDRASGELVGESVLHEWHPADRRCVFRILLGPRGRDRGLGTETLRLTLAHAFEHIGLHRVELGVYTFNRRALRVYEKVGFVTEGVRREAMLRDGEAYDETAMSMLSREWFTHRGYPSPAPAPAPAPER